MWVIVLNDGETYTGVEGTRALFVPPEFYGDSMDEYVKDNYKKGIDLAITESSHSLLSGDIYIPEMVNLES